ncbi:MAG TPA: lysophospholipid acyltransferase family protein, partial [Acidimicrobiales bacterium]|nr:lysophospholipid acyltransferase family protein [Acidimicrobiales bacterium]
MAYWTLKILLTPLLRVLFRVRTEGIHRVPRRGPVILASNHQSFIDSVFLPLVVRRRVTFVAKAEYFESWKTNWFFRAVGMIPLKRDGGSASQRALLAAREVLERGGALGI